MSQFGIRHINRGVTYKERQPKPDSPPELDMSVFGRVMIGRYVDMSARIDHMVYDPIDSRNYSVTSWGSYMEIIDHINGESESKGFSVIKDSVFIRYVDVTDALNEVSTRYTHSQRRATQDRRKYLSRARAGFRRASHEQQSLIDENDYRVIQTLQEKYGDPLLLDDETCEELELQKLISLTGAIWSNGYDLQISPQPKKSDKVHPNGSHLMLFPTVRTVHQLRQYEHISSALKTEGVNVGSVTAQDEAVGVPVLSLFTDLSEIKQKDRPIIPKPPKTVPVQEIELKVFEDLK